ncbi:MAG: HAMP domain-containing histidine kinase [Clostridia bacterium]|nr:HAMP domain-containing histidine kinase [Clostridia bacterium]
MRNIRGTVWFVVVSFVFTTFFCTVLIMTLILLAFLYLDIIDITIPLRALSIVVFMLMSIFIGTILASLFGRVIITPVKNLSNAMKKVSHGDFTVRVDYDHDNEIGALTQEFNKMVSDLGSIETLRNDFVTNVSHEFKTPLASIEGCATLLQDENLSDAERSEYAALIAASARQLSVLTSNILRLSKLENQQIVPSQTTFSLDEQIRLAVLMLEPQWSGQQTDLDIDLDSVTVFGAEELLMQVWLNLIGNAIKFTDIGGRVTISLREKGGTISVTVSDNGAGMAKDVVQHIFDKFYQGDNSRSRSGNGLGLALVKRILDLTGGQISVDSTPGKGSAFTVTLHK